MSNFSSVMEIHIGNIDFESLFELIEKCRGNNELGESEFETINRIDMIYRIVESRLSSIDPLLLSEEVVNELYANTSAITEKLTVLVENCFSADVLQNIDLIHELLDSVTVRISQVFVPLVPQEIESLKDSIVSTRQSLAQHNRYIREEYEGFKAAKEKVEIEIDTLTNKLAFIETEVDKIVETASEQLTEFEKTFSEKEVERSESSSNFQSEIQSEIALMIKNATEQTSEVNRNLTDNTEEKLNQLEEFKENINSKIENLIENAKEQMTELDQTFSERQDERSEHFNNLQIEWQRDFNEKIDKMKETFSIKMDELNEDFHQHITKLDSRRDKHDKDVQIAKEELYKLIEVAGNDVMSDGYAKYANKAAVSKLIWQILSVICLIGLVLAAYFIIPTLEQEKFSWSILAARTLLTVSVGTLAGFTIRQAHLSHQEEKRNRDMQLKLGSIEPYLKNFEPEKRNEIKEKLVFDYFSQEGNTVGFQNELESSNEQKWNNKNIENIET